MAVFGSHDFNNCSHIIESMLKIHVSITVSVEPSVAANALVVLEKDRCAPVTDVTKADRCVCVGVSASEDSTGA